jgi:hypothetical protein
MGVGRNFARGRCDGWIAVVEEGSMEEERAKSVKVGETERRRMRVDMNNSTLAHGLAV